MKSKHAVLAAIGAGVVLVSLISRPPATFAQSLLEPGLTFGIDGAGFNTPEGALYADGTKAINQGRWSDALSIFSKLAADHGDHAAGALYWKAYAENKLSQSDHALETCAALRLSYSGSTWIDDCGALEIEIHAKSGKPVQPKAKDSDEVRLLALNSLMQQNESKARAQIQEILDSDSSEILKESALFILGENGTNANYPQIVRISYLEGDVRVERGEAKDAVWEKAVTGLPLETGFNLVTGNGRVEIELEDASTLYLGENSVLTFNDLHTTSGVPHTEIALLSGTLTQFLDSLMPGEWALLRTPTDNILTRYPAKSDLRVTSYMDATDITALRAGSLRLNDTLLESSSEGQSFLVHNGQRIEESTLIDSTDFSAWDKWVKDRHDARVQATADVMKEAGLTEPIPGLAEMKGKGTFFDCAPYGNCWQPAKSDEPQESEPNVFAASAAPKKSVDPGLPSDLYMFPCMPDALHNRAFANYGVGPVAFPYEWTVCHAGSWIHNDRGYAWVVGHKRHHHCPVTWVKAEHKVAYVPIHPHDVKGQPPINRPHAFMPTHDNKLLSIQPTQLDRVARIETLKSPPREFRSAPAPALTHVEAPHIEAHNIRAVGINKGAVARSAGIPLTFDHKTQTFMMASHSIEHGHSVSSSVPINNHGGNLQSHGGSYSGGGGSHGGSAGGSHSGGGGSSSGGGSHSGGTSSASSSSSSGSSAASSSAGSSHH